MDKYLFQNCQKIVVFNENNTKVLLAKRRGENDYDGIYSFIGGKMETTDKDIVDGLRREKNEEVGSKFVIRINPVFNTMAYFVKKDGSFMVLPHYYAQHIKGKIKLNEEYSDYKWVLISELERFEPKIPNINIMVKRLLNLVLVFSEDEFVVM